MFLRVVSALLCVSVIGCKPKAGTSSLADIATANKVKTGMYTPEKARDVSSGFAGKSRTRSAAELQKLLGVDIATFGGQETYVVPTYEGDQVLVMKQGEARPLPIGGVSSTGQPFYLGASIASLGNGAALVGNTYVRLARANDPLKGTVSADGNQTNMNLVYAVINSLGRQEDYLVSYLNQLDTVGGGKTVVRPARLCAFQAPRQSPRHWHEAFR